MRFHGPAPLIVLAAILGAPAHSEVSNIDIQLREPVLDGRAFGAAGAYEKLTGSLDFSFDVSEPANRAIVDLERGPRDGRGRVPARADFMVLQPVDAGRRRGVALLEVSNRGGKASLRYFNGGVGTADPSSPADFGDGLLMREGLTVIWVGWQHDVPGQPGLLRLDAPVATDRGDPIHGLARSDWVVDERVSTLALGHRDHRPYPAAVPDDVRNVLTVRDGREAPRRVIARELWHFANAAGEAVAAGGTHIHAPDGFEPGHIYELVYVARDPRIAGVGLAAVRDTMAYAKHDAASPFPVERGIAFGASQAGRFLRHFLYQGFNVDERGRRVFDGMLIHSAGAGRGSFNHRFAQASRDAHRYSAFFFPTDLFPFSSHTQSDSETRRRDGLVASYDSRAALPRIFYTNTGYEYWGRAASLIHMRVRGDRDLPPMRNERIYHIASAQHYVEGWPPAERYQVNGTPAWTGNPLDFLVNLRALLVRLVGWVADDRPPPASEYPAIGRGTLVHPADLALPHLSGLLAPKGPHVAYRADYGEEWPDGIIARQPPRLDSAFPSRVPQVDATVNELGGIRNVDIAVPLATYLPWSLRRGLANPTEMLDFRGSFIPLPATDAEAERNGDPRPSIESLYPSREVYLDDVHAAARALVERGYLLAEDVERVTARADERWRWVLLYARRPAAAEGGAR